MATRLLREGIGIGRDVDAARWSVDAGLVTRGPGADAEPWGGDDRELDAHAWALGDLTVIRYRANDPTPQKRLRMQTIRI